MKTYKISRKTLALVPLSKKKTVVYELNDYFILDNSVSTLISDNCEYYGSSLNGRLKGTYSLLGFNYKAPIVMSEEDDIIFFPTCSPRLKECSWINSSNINKISREGIDKTLIQFINNEEISVESTYNIIKNQYLKSLSLNNALNLRKNKQNTL